MKESIILAQYKINRRHPQNYKDGELDFCKGELSYDTSNIQLIECRNCLVNHKGFVYNHYFQINCQSLLSVDYYVDYFNFKHYIKKVLLKKKKRLDPERRYLLAFNEWGHVHYHWFCDTLPRIYSVRDILHDYYLLLPGKVNYINTVALESLKLLGLRPKGIEFVEPRDLMKVKQLSIITEVCRVGYINDKLMKKIAMHFYKSLDGNSFEPTRKLYISRQGADYRKVLNENEVQEEVKKFGYEVIRFENMSLLDQAKATLSAKSIVSLHGAGLTNMIFMRRGCNVLEFRRNRIFHNQSFWHLADALDHNYFYLFGEPDDDSLPIESNGCNLTIDIEVLNKTLKEIDDFNDRSPIRI